MSTKSKERTIAAEEKQLRKLTSRQAKGNYKGYFFVLVFLIGLVNILDEVTSNLSVSVQSSFITEFFVNNPMFGKTYTFEASGAGAAVKKAVEIMAPKGTFTVVGRNSKDTVIPTATFEWLMRREMTLKGCWGYNLAGEDEVMQKGIAAFKAKKLVSHLLKPEEMSDMLDNMWNHTCDFCKVLIDFTEES